MRWWRKDTRLPWGWSERILQGDYTSCGAGIKTRESLQPRQIPAQRTDRSEESAEYRIMRFVSLHGETFLTTSSDLAKRMGYRPPLGNDCLEAVSQKAHGDTRRVKSSSPTNLYLSRLATPLVASTAMHRGSPTIARKLLGQIRVLLGSSPSPVTIIYLFLILYMKITNPSKSWQNQAATRAKNWAKSKALHPNVLHLVKVWKKLKTKSRNGVEHVSYYGAWEAK